MNPLFDYRLSIRQFASCNVANFLVFPFGNKNFKNLLIFSSVMVFIKKFIKLMKSVPKPNSKKPRHSSWTIDESKCLSIGEVQQLRTFCTTIKINGLKNKKFSPVRNWFLVELGLNTGLRVEELASLKHKNLLLNGPRSSIVVLGKGNKTRSVWIGSKFKIKCQAYIGYKRKFNYNTDDDSYLLNNLKGNKITKRALQKFFKSIVKKSTLPDYYHIHNLRHTYSTFFLKASRNNYRFLQDQLGHASITTTQVYAAVVESEGRKALERLYE
jgi:integrase/recombinase XerC